MPELPLTNTQQGRQKVVIEMARSENLTIRQLYKRVATARGHRVVVGTPERYRRRAGGVVSRRRGRRLQHHAADPAGGLNDFVELVVPELQRRGLFRTEYEGNTLRENLGLPRPANRFAAKSFAAE